MTREQKSKMIIKLGQTFTLIETNKKNYDKMIEQMDECLIVLRKETKDIRPKPKKK